MMHKESPKYLEIYVVYNNPSDFPGKIVSRKFEVSNGASRPTNEIMMFATVDEVTEFFEGIRKVKINRSIFDDPVIMECWL